MRYVDNRIEIQYRECQILRDAAKAVLVENVDRGVLFSQKERWLRSISDIAKSMKLKKKSATVLVQILSDIVPPRPTVCIPMITLNREGMCYGNGFRN